MPEQPCPTIDELTDYLLGRSDQQRREELGDHVEICSACQAQLHTVSDAGDTLVSTLRRQISGASFEDESDCQNVLQHVAAIGRDPSFSSAGRQHAAAASDHPQTIRDYELLEKLGEGGMGAVYKALHTQLEKVVALKILPTARMRDQSAVARFKREMKAVGKLEHPNIVGAMDAGEDQGVHYLVMQYVEGLDLSALARRVGPSVPCATGSAGSASAGTTISDEARAEPVAHSGMTVADACELIRQAADGLQHAHEHGMVHRDIKPSNLMLTPQGRVKILDLGLALLSENGGQPGAELTSTGQMMGTLDYMAPEQGSSSHEVDIRADVYALGATLYRLLTGQAPFADEQYNTPVKKMMALATEEVPSLGTKRDDLPAELVTIVGKMLAKNPDDRFTTPQEVADALVPFAERADLAALLDKATAEGSESTEEQSAVVTHESLKSGSVDTDQTIEMESSSDSPREEREASVAGVERSERALGEGLPTSPKPTTKGLRDAGATREPGRPKQVARSGDLATALRTQRWWANRRNQFIAAALGGTILLGAILLYFKTGSGTIVVEIDDPTIQVTIEGEELKITKDQSGEAYGIKPGKKVLHVTRGDLKFDTDKFELRRGEKVVLAVRLVAGQVQVKRGDGQDARVIGRSTLPLEATAKKPGESPLDKLDPANIPPAERAVWQAEGVEIPGAELVAVLGEHRGGHDRLGNWQYRPNAIGFTADGKFAVTAAGDGVRLWDVEGMRPRAVIPVVPGARGLYAAVSPVENLLAVNASQNYAGTTQKDLRLRLYKIEDGKPEFLRSLFSDHEREVDINCLAFSPDGRRLLTGGTRGYKMPDGKTEYKGDLCLWDVHTDKEIQRFDEHENSAQVVSVAWSPDGRRFATFAARDAVIHIWDADKLVVVRQLQLDRPETHLWMTFSADAKRLYANTYVWNVEDGKELSRNAAIFQMAMFKDGKRAGYAWGSSVRVVDLGTGVDRLRLPTTAGIPGGRSSLVLSPDEKRILTIDSDRGVHLWDADSGKELYPRTGHVARIECLEFSPDGQLLASGGFDGTVRLWDISGKAAKERAVLRGNLLSSYTKSVTFSPGGKILASLDPYGNVHSWDVTQSPPKKSGVVNNQYTGHWHNAWYNAQGNRLIHCRAGADVRWIDTSGSALPQKLSTLTDQITRTPDGKRMVCVSSSGQVQLWDTSGTDAKLLRQWNDFKLAQNVVLHPNGEMLAEPRVQEFAVGNPQVVLQMWDIRVEKASLVAKFDPQPVKSWSWQEIGQNGGFVALVPQFSPDGQTLWLLDAEGRAYAWDVASRKLIHRWKVPTHCVDFAITPDGRHIAVSSRLGAVSILRLEQSATK